MCFTVQVHRSLPSTTTGQGAAAQGRPRSDYKGWEGFVGGENTNKTTSGRCCSPQDRLATQGSSAKSYSGSREATRAHFHPHPITSAGATKGLASRTTHSACNDWQEKLIRTTAGAGLSLGAVPTPPGLDAPSAGGSQTPAASPPRRCSQRW